MTGRVVLSARGIRISRGGGTILAVDSLDLHAGETLALIGPNGAGKSTLLQCLATLTQPDEGEITFHGVRISEQHGALAYRRSVATVFQEALLLDMSVGENVGLGLKLRGASKLDIEEAVERNLARFAISHLKERNARSLSGGEAQRTSLARAFAVRPQIIFLDEPFSALDPPTREGLLVDLGLTLRESGASSVFVTHDRSEALYLADRLAVMRAGRIAQEGAPQEVINAPLDGETASFVGMETLLKGEIAEAGEGLVSVAVGPARFEAVGEAKVGTEVMIGVRPEYVTLGPPQPSSSTSARNRFTGRVVSLMPLGPLVRVNLDCGFNLTALVTSRSTEELGLTPGMEVGATVKASAVHLILGR